MKEYSWKSDRFWVLLPDCMMVLIAEIFVDWVKHAFITRFNELQVDVYRDYTTSLAYDMAETRQKHAFSDHSDLVARRMGFIPLPLGVVMVRVLAHAVHIGDMPSLLVSLLAYLGLSSYRVLNNILILGFACALIIQHKYEKTSAHSPCNNRAGSPLTVVNKSHIARDLLKDTATSPVKPVVDTITACPVIHVNGATILENKSSDTAADRISDLGPAAIFANSTVDLKYASLNEELLKVEGENIKIEPVVEETFTRSNPNIKCDQVQCEEASLRKRAESEPNLANCKDDNALIQ